MSTRRKLLYAAGALILLVVQFVIAFALGVYVGRYGLTREGLSLQGPNNQAQPAAPAAPAAPAGPAQLGEPAVIGRIRHLGPRVLSLATREGPRQATLDADTRYMDPAGQPITRIDLAAGQIVAVWGVFDDGGQQLRADLVVIVPEQQPGPAEVEPPAKP